MRPGLACGLLSLAASVQLQLFAQAAAVAVNPNRAEVPVPFIGCVSYGQTEFLEAPKGTSKSVPISPDDAQKLAYYASADGIGILAPRGWFCEGVSGSSGPALFVSPKPIKRGLTGQEGFEGPAIEISHTTSDAIGRLEIAEIMARMFPAYRAFARRAWDGIDAPLPSGPYPKDTLKYRSKAVVEYVTPPYTEGLGTHFSWLKKNDSPIAGTAILIGDPPVDLLLLSMRLPRDLARLTPVIIRDVERDAVHPSHEGR